jgi:hypothetical protein
MPNVVNGEGVAQQLLINGDKPFFIPTEFHTWNLSFTKSGEGYQALRLPFDTWEGLGIVSSDDMCVRKARFEITPRSLSFPPC